jgi:hypothetical protein
VEYSPSFSPPQYRGQLSLLAVSIVGAFQLRQDERLSEENFLKLMALSFKYLPWIRSKVDDPDKDNTSSPVNI